MAKVGVDNEALLERLVFAYDGADYRVVTCDTDGNLVAAIKAGQTIEVTQDTAADLLATVTIPTGQDILARLQGYYGAGWRNAPVPFGPTAAYNESATNESLAAGTNTLEFTSVAASTILVVTNCVFMYSGTPPTTVGFAVASGGSIYHWWRQNVPVSAQYYDRQGWWALGPGDKPQLRILGATLNDNVYGYIGGFTMSVA